MPYFLLVNLLAGLLEATRDEGALPGHQLVHARVVHSRVHVALHESAAVVVLDVPHPSWTKEREREREIDKN
jgi:hypothetical protein